MEKTYKAASYGRLSREDGDNLESESIINQRDFIRNYIEKNANMILVEEYFDDGYSGGNFDRPAWRKLMNDVAKKRVDTIITKDLSRMGRDYLSMGDYIEKTFPESGIRYIAINDDIDTLYETPGRDFLQFKLVFNDYYLKDTSKKIKKIMRIKKEQGQYTGWKGIYGYKRDPSDNHKLIVDENVRNIVVRMFDLAKKGYGPRAIANIFSLEKIPNPSTYANLVRKNKTITSFLWSDRTIRELLENPTYIGHLTQGTRKKVSYKSKKEVRVPKSEWIIVENTHEPIIDCETFDTVQELLKKNRNNTNVNNEHLLRGFLYCKECGHRIGINSSRDKKRRYCICCFYAAHSKFGVCTPHSMNYDKLESAVLNELRSMFKKYIDEPDLVSKIFEAKSESDFKDKIRKEIDNLALQIKQNTNRIDMSYIDRLDGKIDFEQYTRATLKFNNAIEELTIKKRELSKKLNSIDNKVDETEKTLNRMREFLSLKTPTRELLVNLIDRIDISEEKIVEIHYKFKES